MLDVSKLEEVKRFHEIVASCTFMDANGEVVDTQLIREINAQAADMALLLAELIRVVKGGK